MRISKWRAKPNLHGCLVERIELEPLNDHDKTRLETALILAGFDQLKRLSDGEKIDLFSKSDLLELLVAAETGVLIRQHVANEYANISSNSPAAGTGTLPKPSRETQKMRY